MLHFPRWKTILVWLTVLVGILYTLPNILPKATLAQLPSFLPNKTLSLGLDLQGGSHLLKAMEEKELIKKWAKTLRGDVQQTLRDARIGYVGLRVKNHEYVEVTIREKEKFQNAVTKLNKLNLPVEGAVFGGAGEGSMKIEKDEAAAKITFKSTEPARRDRMKRAIEAAIEVYRSRIDALGTTEPIIQRQGYNRVVVQVPGYDDPEHLKEVLEGAGVLSFHAVDHNANVESAKKGILPPGSSLYQPLEGSDETALVLEDREIVTGRELVDAKAGYDQFSKPAVLFRFDRKGARRVSKFTKENVGKRFAIVLDQKIVSAPVVNEPITTGSGQITGNFTVKTADELAIKMRSGSLPVALDLIEERTVGASLGADSVKAGGTAAVIGLIAVLIFILMAYGLFGVFANMALLINIGLLIGALSYLGATLTLPGIAGIVLTMGMAVDANVLIFERIREEIRAGKGTIKAIEQGYGRAMSTILDANITTLLAAIILFWLGSGPVKGFAVTLSIGIVTSVFTAVTVTRWIVSMWISRQPSKTIPAPI